jgi:putative Flp pilus-assembly TadE/G-like protein
MNKDQLLLELRHAISRPALLEDTTGAVAVTVAIVLVVLLSFAALALDISNAMIARNELQNAADAAALAGARQLGVIYQALPQGTPYTVPSPGSPCKTRHAKSYSPSTTPILSSVSGTARLAS